jgi:2-dehydropantoate 2-reductase
MRASIGDIVAAGGAEIATAVLDECAAVAADQGFAPRDAAQQRSRTMFTTAGSPLTASMLRDIEQGKRTEVEHILGDLMRRGKTKSTPLVRTAYVHVAAYEARRAREAHTAEAA